MFNKSSELKIKAPAKINLYLHLVGKKDNGYHLLESLVAFTDLGDWITLKTSSDLVFEVDGPFKEKIPHTDDNLVMRAAKTLAEFAQRKLGAHIHLYKDLPPASCVPITAR